MEGTIPGKMDFEAKYEAAKAPPFDQKNEMFKRMDWDERFEDMLGGFHGIIPADGRIGATNENMAHRIGGRNRMRTANFVSKTEL